MAPEHAPVLHMIGAVMAPVVQMLRDEQQKERAMHRASMDQLLQQKRQLSQQLDRVKIRFQRTLLPTDGSGNGSAQSTDARPVSVLRSWVWKQQGKSWAA